MEVIAVKHALNETIIPSEYRNRALNKPIRGRGAPKRKAGKAWDAPDLPFCLATKKHKEGYLIDVDEDYNSAEDSDYGSPSNSEYSDADEDDDYDSESPLKGAAPLEYSADDLRKLMRHDAN